MKSYQNKILSFAIGIIVSLAVIYSNFISITVNATGAEVEEDLYVIQSLLDNSKVLDVEGRNTSNGSNCQLYDRNNSVAQIFRITSAGSGYYTIQLAVTSDMVLDVSGGNGFSGCNVQLYETNGTDAQLWTFEPLGFNTYYIKSKTGYYLDVAGGNSVNGTNIQIYEGNQTDAQKFTLVKNYSVKKAVDYARTYTDNSGSMEGTYNSKFNRYSGNNWFNPYRGYDCANFGSQCLLAGGLYPTDQWEPVYNGEKYKNNTAKTNWVSAINMYSYLSSLGYPTESVKEDLSNIHEGDIVFTNSGGHMTICTGYSNGAPVYCAHSFWRKDYPYSYKDLNDGIVIDMSFSSCGTVRVTNLNTYTIRSSIGAKVRSQAGLSYGQKGGLAMGTKVYYDKSEYSNGYEWYHIVKAETTSGSWGEYIGYWVANI